MPDVIRLLPDNIANQIAAGEVIQRPASLVKELLENSIDAGASKITLIIKDAGKTLVRVIDNGSGMSETDARLSFERHATSKIRKAEDLFHISTKGFRGEALASIASVAMVEMKTRLETEDIGSKIRIEGSELIYQQAEACPVGTDISVNKLFYNIPARRKFLKSDTVEYRHILNEFNHIVLAHPELQFEMFHNDKLVHKLPVGNPKKRLVSIIGKQYEDKLIHIEEETEIVTINGFVSTSDATRRRKGDQYLFINNRYFRSPYFNHAIYSAYESLIEEGSYPAYSLFLSVPPEKIDVNVHPTKQEIKFQDERTIYNYIKVSVRHGLAKFHLLPVIDFEPPSILRKHGSDTQNPFESTGSGMGTFKRERGTDDWERMFEGLGNKDSGDRPAVPPDPEMFPEGETAGEIEEKRILQVANSYIVCPLKSGFVLIDQHAAHFRILYEDFLVKLEQEQSPVQTIAFPQTLELSVDETEIMEMILPQLKRVGYDISPFGKNSYVIHGVPAATQIVQLDEQSLRVILSSVRENLNNQVAINEQVSIACARIASIKKGKKLKVEEMRMLVDQLFSCRLPDRTPTGRYCFISYTPEDIERRFKAR